MAKKIKYGHRESFPRYFKADFELQQKIGTGTLDADAVARVQQYLDTVQIDVSADLRKLMSEMKDGLDAAREMSYDREEFMPQISRALMNIKAMSGMFHEMMLCRVSAFMLTFLDDVRKLDTGVIEILGAYLKVAHTLLELKIRDETNPHGQSFLNEIRAAAKRYYDKQASSIKG